MGCKEHHFSTSNLWFKVFSQLRLLQCYGNMLDHRQGLNVPLPHLQFYTFTTAYKPYLFKSEASQIFSPNMPGKSMFTW